MPDVISNTMLASRIFDAIAGFIGALIAASYQEKTSYGKILSSLLIGTLSAVIGAPVLAEWQTMTRAGEYLTAALVGLTAQTHIIPGLLDAASLLRSAPAQLIRKKLGLKDDGEDDA